MGAAKPYVQWGMNFTLAQIGIDFPDHRARALAIGEKLGVFRDYPVSKGCTSPFAPIWIGEMVRMTASRTSTSVVDIPKDYDGNMGVPITFLDKYNPGQFQILGCFEGGTHSEALGARHSEKASSLGRPVLWNGP